MKSKLLKINMFLILALAAISISLINFKPLAKTSAATLGTDYLVLEADSKYLSDGYLDKYSVPSSYFTYSNNGGSKSTNPLSNAFDRNFNNYWKSDLANQVNDFINFIDIKFNSKVEINRIIYGGEPGLDKGYPIQLKIYAQVDGDFEEIKYFNTTPTNKNVMFILDAPINCSAIRFEYVEVYRAHYWNATARELMLLQPESEEVEEVENIFTDYNCLTLQPGTDMQKINELRQKVKNKVVYEHLNSILERAELVLNKKLVFDPRREMTTNPDGDNVIAQHGEIRGYAQKELKMVWLGTNRQSTGITLNAGQKLNIYVEANEGDKLPQVSCSQFWGHYSLWNGGALQLKPGKNTLTAPDFITPRKDLYAVKDVVAGGPVYISNSYLPNEQPQNIKIYFEGGTVFPVYHKGEEEGMFKRELQDYAQKVEAEPEKYVDVTELVSDHFIMTVRSTSAAQIYQTKSPNANLVYWDDYMQKLLEFDGVKFSNENGDTKEQNFHYDERNKYINCNIRMMQPYGAAYAYTEHVGIQPSWEGGAIYSQSNGWGFTHELGHMMDNSERTVSECSNNMMSKFDETALEKTATRGDFAKTFAALTPEAENRESYWLQSDRMNYLVWWLIESYDIGAWGRMENYYRYYDGDTSGLNSTEKQIYFCSLATGVDLSYYFERWGYNLNSNDPIFKLSNASAKFTTLMSEAKASGKISQTKRPKLWYLDAKQYLENQAGHTNIYSSTDEVAIQSVAKSNGKHTLILTSPKSSNPAHLGYEVWEGSNLVGFTYTNVFVDSSNYSYSPNYSIIAFDRGLNESKRSATKSATSQQDVCKLNDVKYNSISAAISSADSGSTIYLLKDVFESNIVVDKDITIEIDSTLSSSITIHKLASGDVFQIQDGATLTLLGTESKKIIVDGNNFAQQGALFRVEGLLNLTYVVLQNSINSSNGGAINLVGTGVRKNYLIANNVEFENNSANNGAAIYNSNSMVEMVINNCKFSSNIASTSGGAIYNTGVIRLNNCQFESNFAIGGGGGGLINTSGGVVELTNARFANNGANFGGGIYADGRTTLTSCTIESNNATTYGGGIYFSASRDVRELIITSSGESEGSKILSNSAKDGSAVYINRGIANFGNTNISSNTSCENAQIAVNGGMLRIYGQATIGEDIFKSQTAQILVMDEMFNFTQITIKIESPEEDAQIMSSAEHTFSEEEIENLKLNYGKIKISPDGKELLVETVRVEIEFKINGVSTVLECTVGERLVMPTDCGIEGKFIQNWKNSQTNEEILPNSEISIKEGCTFEAKLGDMFKITLRLNGATIYEYVIPNEDYYLPNIIVEGQSTIGWLLADEFYLPNAHVDVKSNLEFEGVFTKLFNVSVYFQGNQIESRFCEFKDTLSLDNLPAIPEGYEFDCFEVNGKKVGLGDTVEITNDTSITILIKEIPARPSANVKLIVVIAILSVAALSIVVVLIYSKFKGKIKK